MLVAVPRGETEGAMRSDSSRAIKTPERTEMKVVFAYPSWTGEYGLFGHFAKRNSTWPPLNLALLAAITEQAGHEAVIIDGEAERLKKENLAKKVVESKPDLVGLTCYSPFFHLSADIAEEIKKLDPSIQIMVGGPHITIMKEKAFLPQFDYAFVGEAETSLASFLVEYSRNGERNIDTVGGLFFRRGGETCSSGDPKWVADATMQKTDLGKHYPLDGLPFPARHLLPMKKYRLGTMHGRSHFTSIQTARGCPWTCIFCASEELKTTRYVMRSPKMVVAEMCDIALKYPYVSHLYNADDVMTFWPEHITEICDRMDAEGLKFTFEGSTRANLVTDELMARMAKSGLIRLSFGLETVDPVMRVTMQKKVPLDAYAKANKICREHGVEAMNSLMIGLPGETTETIRSTIDWVRESRDILQANLAIAIPYPGTEFHEMAINGMHGMELVSKDFSKYMRYGSGVTKVGELTSQDLVDLQNEGFVRIYSAPWRWLPVWKKHGTVGFLLQMVRLFRLWKKKFFQKMEPFRVHPGLPK